MMFLKTRIDGKGPIKLVDIYDDEIIAFCPKCGDEVQVDLEKLRIILNNGGDFSSTSVCCESCSSKRPRRHLRAINPKGKK